VAARFSKGRMAVNHFVGDAALRAAKGRVLVEGGLPPTQDFVFRWHPGGGGRRDVNCIMTNPEGTLIPGKTIYQNREITSAGGWRMRSPFPRKSNAREGSTEWLVFKAGSGGEALYGSP